jgi:ankyrin repeat protein
VFCQLEVLRHCLPASIRQTLDRLPKSLDETYLRVLNQIAQVNQAHAHRMLQCLVVAARPLRVKELAELLAFEFDDAKGGIPKHRAAWRLDDRTQAVLSTCSSLVTIIDVPWDGGQVVQFSHFSVKEFLISNRLPSSLGDLSRYHIRLGSAHTILTQACLGSLLQAHDHIEESAKGLPLTNYAAQHWVDHAQFEDVASHVKVGMETLFDPDKPHFAAWIGIHDIDGPLWLYLTTGTPTPLYYSALCGFYDLVKHLAVKHPQYVNAIGGRYHFPLLAALWEDHMEVAELLIELGANVDFRETTGETILLNALSQPQHNIVDIVKFLLRHGTDVNARDGTLRSSLHLAESQGELEVAQMLVNHGADVNSRDSNGKTPFHILSESRANNGDLLNHALLLLKHGAEVNSRDTDDQTPIHLAIGRDRFQLAQLLLEHGADANAETNSGKTPLHILSERKINGEPDVDVLNHEHSMTITERNEHHKTPSHPHSNFGPIQMAQALLKHGANVNAGISGGMASGEYHL